MGEVCHYLIYEWTDQKWAISCEGLQENAVVTFRNWKDIQVAEREKAAGNTSLSPPASQIHLRWKHNEKFKQSFARLMRI